MRKLFIMTDYTTVSAEFFDPKAANVAFEEARKNPQAIAVFLYDLRLGQCVHFSFLRE